MFITPTAPLPGVQKKFQIQKLGTQVDTCCWNDNSDLLACIADSRLIVYYYPHALYVDKDLLPLTQQIEDGGEFGKMPQVSKHACVNRRALERLSFELCIAERLASCAFQNAKTIGSDDWL